MALDADLQRAWAEHAADAETVASRFPDLCARAEAAEVPAVAGLVVHVLAEHLGRFDEALERIASLGRHGESEALLRSTAVLRLCKGEDPEILLDAFGAARPSSEPRVLAVAAGAVAAHGRTGEAGRWLVRAASLSYALPDRDPAVRSVAVTGNNLAVTLEERRERTPEENSLLRTAAQLARAAWERAGTWVEVERAEYRLAMTHLVLREPVAAIAHALACRAICTGNAADAGERFFAEEVLARALHAGGDVAGARAALDAARRCLPDLPEGLAETGRGTVEGLEVLLSASGAVRG